MQSSQVSHLLFFFAVFACFISLLSYCAYGCTVYAAVSVTLSYMCDCSFMWLSCNTVVSGGLVDFYLTLLLHLVTSSVLALVTKGYQTLAGFANNSLVSNTG